MANAEVKANCSIEAIINKSFLELSQEIYDKYKVKVCSVDLLWLDISTVEKKDQKASRVCLATEYEE